MRILKKSICILLILITLLNSFATLTKAVIIQIGDKKNVVAEKILPGLVQYKYNKAIKLVARVSYKISENERVPAFCLEPEDDGAGTGAGESYETKITQKIQDMRVWRALYHGYLGKSWKDTTVECDDDWYFVTKLVIHCLDEKASPKTIYEAPEKITKSDKADGLTLEITKRRGQKILDEAETLYNYAVNGKDTYTEANLTIEKSGDSYIDGNNLVQKFTLSSKKDLNNYEVSLEKLPEGSTYTKDNNIVLVKIPKENITNDIKGTIRISGAEIKTCLAFYAKAYKEEYQDYVVALAKYENTSAYLNFELKTNKSTLEISKIDKETKKAISDTTLEISKDSQKVATVTTGKDGKATLNNLHPGTYEVKEIKANENYILSDEVKKVNLEYGKTSEVEFENTRKTGNLKLVKVDKDNNKIVLGNIEFDLYSEEMGKVIGTYYTDCNGEIVVKNLRVGNYIWIEKKTNKDYVLNESKIEVTVKWNETEETIVENELKKGQIKVIKVDKDNEQIKLAGVVFKVIDQYGNVLENIKTDENGEAVTKRYALRDFEKLTIQEATTLENYVLDENPQTITLKENQIVDVVFKNEQKKGKIKVIKVDADNNEIKIPNVEFRIYDENDNLVNIILTNQSGIAISKELPVNQKYKIKETKTGKWYTLDENMQTVELKQGEITELTIKNEKKKGQIKVIKLDKENSEIKLPNVEFNVYDEEGNIVDTLITDENGEAITKKLPIDKNYIVQETKTLENYLLNAEPQTVVLEENQISYVVLTNKRIKGHIEITKVSAEDNKLSGKPKGTLLANAVFEVYSEENTLVDTITTGEDGKGISTELDYGKYYIKEKSSGSDYYLINPNTYEVEISSKELTVKITIENPNVDVGLEIDKTGVSMAKANDEIKYSFSLKNTSNVYIDNFTWTDNLPYKYVKITKLYTGVYNEDLNYTVKYKTNKTKDYIEFGKYNTTTNNYIDFTKVKLAKDEYITDFKLEFGTVKPGFEAVQKPILYTKVLPNVKANEKWENNTFLTGTYKHHNLEDKAKWPTTSYEIKLPRTGF